MGNALSAKNRLGKVELARPSAFSLPSRRPAVGDLAGLSSPSSKSARGELENHWQEGGWPEAGPSMRGAGGSLLAAGSGSASAEHEKTFKSPVQASPRASLAARKDTIQHPR